MTTRGAKKAMGGSLLRGGLSARKVPGSPPVWAPLGSRRASCDVGRVIIPGMAVSRTFREANGPTTPLLWLPDFIICHGDDPEAVCRSVGLDYQSRKKPLTHLPLSHYAHSLAALDRRLKQPGGGRGGGSSNELPRCSEDRAARSSLRADRGVSRPALRGDDPNRRSRTEGRT